MIRLRTFLRLAAVAGVFALAMAGGAVHLCLALPPKLVFESTVGNAGTTILDPLWEHRY